jgi:hypothetical protein
VSERRELAEALLREIVFRSRAKQAVQGLFAEASKAPENRPAGGGRCGLGERAALELGLDETGRGLLERLFGEEPAEADVARLRDVAGAWVERQDAFDRKRNHYLRDFRAENGADRHAYSAEVLADFERGLAALAEEETRARGAAAERVLGRAQ